MTKSRTYAGEHKSIINHSKESFFYFLEEIAISTWYGDGRTTTVDNIEKTCKEILEMYTKKVEEGIMRLLMAFYFKGTNDFQGKKFFEFIYKSFREYLTARELENLQEDIKNIQEKVGMLRKWAAVCRYTTIDMDLYRFIEDEIKLRDKETGLNF